MADDLDALFELFDDDDAEEGAGPNVTEDSLIINTAGTAPTATDGQHDADDMLLCLADAIATEQQVKTRPPCKQPPTAMKAPAWNPQRSLSHTAGPVAPHAASTDSTRTLNPPPSSTPSAVQMSRSGAFAAMNKASKPSNAASTGRSLPPAAAEATLATSSYIGTSGSSSTGTAAGITVQQQQQQQRRSGECLHYVEKLTNLKIRNPRVSGIVMRERYKQLTYVPISKARDHDPGSSGGGWVVIGVLVTKSISTTSQGSPYSRWRLSDLAGSDSWISLFGDAHKDNYAEAEGSILAFYNPKFSNKGPGGSTSHSSSSNGLAVSQSHQVELLATSAGWGFCKGKTKTGARCNNAVDITVSCYCQYHALQQAKTLKKPAAAVVGGVRKFGGQGGVRNGLGLAGAAAAATGGGDKPPPTVAAASNGKVFDAKSNSWSSSAATTATAVVPSSSLARPGGSSSSSRLGSSTGPVSGSSSNHSSTQVQHQQPKTAAENNNKTTAVVSAAGSLRQPDGVREKLRQLMQQRQSTGQAATTLQVASARAPQQISRAAAPCNMSTGFSLSTVLAAVSSGDKQQKQQQQQYQARDAAVEADDPDDNDDDDDDEQWLDIQQENLKPAAAATAAGTAVDNQLEGRKRPCIAVRSQQAQTRTTADAVITASTAGVTGISKPVGPMHQPSAAAGASGTTRSGGKPSIGQRLVSKADKKLRADLGLGPKPGSSSSSSRAASGSSSSKPPHVSRIGVVGAAVQQKCLGSGAGLGSRGSGGGNSSNSGFKAAFSRVLQREDVTQPRTELLAAAADQKHAAMMSKLLDHYEQKDQLAQQLVGITKLQVTAFECRTCNFLTEKRRATCTGHDVVAVRVMKRWWTCDACGWKVHTLREMFPSKRCPKCRDPGVLFTATSAYNAPKPQLSSGPACAIASRDALLPRGTEHAFCLPNSL